MASSVHTFAEVCLLPAENSLLAVEKRLLPNASAFSLTDEVFAVLLGCLLPLAVPAVTHIAHKLCMLASALWQVDMHVRQHCNVVNMQCVFAKHWKWACQGTNSNVLSHKAPST